MHLLRILLVGGLGFFGTATPTVAHLGALVPIPQLTDDDLTRIDLFDESVDDWVAVVGDPALTARDFSGAYDPHSLDFRIWLAWHDGTDRLYCALERTDDTYYNDFGDRVPGNLNLDFFGHDSCLFLAVDGDHSGGPFLDVIGYLEPEFADVQAQMYTTLAQTYGRDLLIKMVANVVRFTDRWFLQPPFADAGGGSFGEQPTISVNEFYITPFDRFDRNAPAASTVTDLAPGAVIGLWMRIDDRDQPEWTWSVSRLFFPPSAPPDGDFAWSSDLFADGLLLPLFDTANPDVATSASSWARIKAGLDLRADGSWP